MVNLTQLIAYLQSIPDPEHTEVFAHEDEVSEIGTHFVVLNELLAELRYRESANATHN